MIRRTLRRPTGWFAVAVVLAAVAGLMTMRAAATDTPTATVLVAAVDLQVGVRLDPPDRYLAVAAIPTAGVLPGMARDLDAVRGRVVAVPVGAGEPVTQATLGGSPGVGAGPLRVGQRAVSVPAAAAGAAAAVLVPGVRVDVLAPALDRSGDARVVVADAEVLAQTPPPGADAAVAEGGALLLRVDERDALRLSAALDMGGGVRVLARPVEPLTGTAP